MSDSRKLLLFLFAFELLPLGGIVDVFFFLEKTSASILLEVLAAHLRLRPHFESDCKSKSIHRK